MVVGGSCSGHRHSVTASTWTLLQFLHVLGKYPLGQGVLTEPSWFPREFLVALSKEIMSTVPSAQSSCLQQPVSLFAVSFIGAREMHLLNNKRIPVFCHSFCHYLEVVYLWQRIKQTESKGWVVQCVFVADDQFPESKKHQKCRDVTEYSSTFLRWKFSRINIVCNSAKSDIQATC